MDSSAVTVLLVALSSVFGVGGLVLAARAGSMSARLDRQLADADAALARLHATLDRADDLVATLAGDTSRLVDELDGAVDEARRAAEVIDRRAKGAYRAIAEPVIKTAAAASGGRRAVRRLRNGSDTSMAETSSGRHEVAADARPEVDATGRLPR